MEHSQEMKYTDIKRGQLPSLDISHMIRNTNMNINELTYSPELISILMYLQRAQRKNLQWLLLDENKFREFISSSRIDRILYFFRPRYFQMTELLHSDTRVDTSIVSYMNNYSKHTFNILKLGKGNLVIAGGFVTRYGLNLCSRYPFKNILGQKVNFYFVGIEPGNRYCKHQTSPKADEILDSIFKYVQNTKEKYVITKTDFAISIVMTEGKQEGKIFRFILKLYPRSDIVVGSFDMDPYRGLIEYNKNNKVEMKCTLSYAMTLKTTIFPIDTTNYSIFWNNRITQCIKTGFKPAFPHTKSLTKNDTPDGGIFKECPIDRNQALICYSDDYEGITSICEKEFNNNSKFLFKTTIGKDIIKPFHPLQKSKEEWYGKAYDPLSIKPDRETEIGWLITLKVIRRMPKLIQRKIITEMEMGYVERVTDMLLSIL